VTACVDAGPGSQPVQPEAAPALREAEDATVVPNPWQALRRWTDARIALGRAGVSQPTRPHLAFQLAHAQARDAVHRALDVAALQAAIEEAGWPTLAAHSAAADRHQYLQRPDWGRRLDAPSRQRLAACATAWAAHRPDLVFVVADGLSALAAAAHAVPLLQRVLPTLQQSDWSIAPLVVVEQGRVAVADEVAELLGARMVAVLIGERPGLSSPDSLGVYLTWMPRVGLTDASRNCISNVRPAGLGYDEAAARLLYLLTQARQRQLSGVALKDESAVRPGVSQAGPPALA
jgi:ethanolamine ammonia-lyase small subunit